MKIDILTLFPEMCEGFLGESIIGRARKEKVAYVYGCKDFAELCNKYSKEEINQFIKETITYVKLRFKDVSDSTFDISELPYY